MIGALLAFAFLWLFIITGVFVYVTWLSDGKELKDAKELDTKLKAASKRMKENPGKYKDFWSSFEDMGKGMAEVIRAQNETPRVIERERIVINRSEPNKPPKLWFVVKESSKHDKVVQIWATDNFDRIINAQYNGYVRSFFTTVLAQTAEEAKTKAEKSKKWTEIAYA